MRTLVFAHVTTAADEAYNKTPMQQYVDSLCAEAGVNRPASGRKIPLKQIDGALKGKSITDRIRLKMKLRALDLID